MIEQNLSKGERLEFTYNTDLSLWLFAGSVLAAIVYFFVLEPEQGHIVANYAIPILVFIFGSCWLYLAVKEAPVYVLSDDGFIDNRMGFGKIEWEDVTFAEIKTPAPGSKAGKFLALGVRDGEKYLGRLGNWARKRQNGMTIPGSSYIMLDAKYIKGAGFGKQKLETAAQTFIKRLGKPDVTPVQPDLLTLSPADPSDKNSLRTMQEIKLSYRSKVQPTLLTAAFLLITFFIYFAFAEGQYWNLMVAGVWGSAGVGFAILWLYFVTRPDVLLTIGPNGILDNQGGFGMIPWEDIEELQLIHLNYIELGIKFKDPAKYGVSDSAIATIRRKFFAKGFSTVSILGLDTAEVLTTAQYFLEESRKQQKRFPN